MLPVNSDIFERDMGCTETEWLGCLPGAVGKHTLVLENQRALVGDFLKITWKIEVPRTIALISISRLRVRFEFENCSEESRTKFMKYFDLYTQRGGG